MPGKSNKSFPRIDRIISYILLFSITFLVLIHVFCRLISRPLYGAEEMERYLFVSMVFLSLSYVAQSDSHIRFDSLISLLNPKLRRVVDTIIYFLCVIVFAITTVSGVATIIGNAHTRTASLGIPFIVLSLPAVIGIFLMTVSYLRKLFKNLSE
ncbi:TRAP transporter small permease [Marispirochaeta aestuarii]|uniref:TRAP transporter small permease n=1 Tax=Marispirochaeta aestuarii TaxID=1963862 RepID=UPI001301D7C5